ncbi:MAG: hypothetical protein D6711_03865 [Chloroflexi bacterium]|nr:MAG: hypothetical protein D6711_03865 [Chloroflexota bacterium]
MRRALLLFIFLCAVYLLTYSGRITLNDEAEMYDITSSIVDFGDRRYDVFNWFAWTRYAPSGISDPNSLYPMSESPIEPVFILSGTPLYWLATQISGVGLLHTTLLLNIFISALASVLIYRYVLLLGYEERLALSAALMLGLMTILWAYSRTYFREPLALLLILLTAFYLEHLRQTKKPIFAGAAVITFLLAYYTKESSLMVVPGLLLIMMPNQWLKRWTDGVLLLVLLVTVVAGVTDVFANSLPEIQFRQYKTGGEFFRIALHGYLISPTASIWATSPIVLLAIPGGWLFLRRNQRRYVWVMLVVLLGLAWGHALSADRHWIGGTTLPPRFIIPALPFMILVSIPALEWLMQHKRWLIGIVLIALYWQFLNAVLAWQEYPDHLPEESLNIVNWQPALDQVRYARPFVLTPVLFEKNLDIAWVRTHVPLWFVMFGGLASTTLFLLWRDWRRRWLWGLPVVLFVMIGVGLKLIYVDPAYWGQNQALIAASVELDQQEQPGDVLLLNDPLYQPFFFNYRLFDKARVVSLQTSPGERGSFEQVPAVVSDNVIDLIDPVARRLIDALATKRKRLWLLMETGPFLPWAIRPIERYMTEYYYPVAEYAFDPTVRLLLFSTVRAPDAPPEIALDQSFGEGLLLTGVTLPLGTTYAAGDILPISFYWRALDDAEQDYTVALFLVDETGAVVAQGRDTTFVGGFVPRLKAGELVQDNRAIQIPDELSAGNYQIWLRLYWFENDTIKTLTLEDGKDITVLPISIQIGK